MNVRVHFFGHLTGITGPAPHDLTLPAAATVQQLLDEIFHLWPALRPHDPTLLTAVNLSYARREETIPPGAEIAIMPPVQGG